MRLETSALLVDVSIAVRSLDVEVLELAAMLVEDDEGEVEEDEVPLLLALEVSSLATDLEDVPTELDGVAVVPLVSFALMLSVELDDFVVSLAATEAEVSDLEAEVSDLDVSAALVVALELGEVVLATELLLGEVADVLLWFDAVRLESEL